MRNMSYSLTKGQVLDGTKDVTRRLGWENLQPGELVMAVEKGMGLKKGERVKRLRVIKVVHVRREPLNAITQEDCVREGFPNMTPAQFVQMFVQHNRCSEDMVITRIEFAPLQIGLEKLTDKEIRALDRQNYRPIEAKGVHDEKL